MLLTIGPTWCLRSYRYGDAPVLQRLANNPRVAANLRDRFPNPYTLQDARQWIELMLELRPETNFVIAADGELCGTIGMQIGEDVHRIDAELGYWLGEPYWGRGIATSAVRVFGDWAFERFPLLERLHAFVFQANPASARVLEKSGFALEGRLRRSVLKRGLVLDQLLYARLRPEEPAE